MRLFVGNLEYSVEAMDLKRLIGAMGYAVTDAFVAKDFETGRSKGYGFVTLDTQEVEADVIEDLDRTPLKGRELAVRKANAKKERK